MKDLLSLVGVAIVAALAYLFYREGKEYTEILREKELAKAKKGLEKLKEKVKPSEKELQDAINKYNKAAIKYRDYMRKLNNSGPRE